jgi:membrane protein
LTFTACIAFGEGFGAYLSEFARSYVSTYAGLASVMIALVFLYFMAGIFIYGGELNAAIMRARERSAEPDLPLRD